MQLWDLDKPLILLITDFENIARITGHLNDLIGALCSMNIELIAPVFTEGNPVKNQSKPKIKGAVKNTRHKRSQTKKVLSDPLGCLINENLALSLEFGTPYWRLPSS